MATSYGYGGEFSSDEDIDRIEQQAERRVHSIYDPLSYLPSKPTQKQVEEMIETLKKLPAEKQDFDANDEELAALLDYYGPARGPIVDSTRSLYKKIVLRFVRGNNADPQGNGVGAEKVGTLNNNNIAAKNSNSTNNNNHLKYPTQHPAESFSSDDDDEPMVPVSEPSHKRSATAGAKSQDTDKIEPMDVDSEIVTGKMHEKKQMDTTDDESDEGDSEEDEDEEEEDQEKIEAEEEEDVDDGEKLGRSDNTEKLDVTPIKPTSHVLGQTPKATSTPLASTRQRQSAKDSLPSTAAKKPFTRSQRIAAAKASITASEAAMAEKPSNKTETDVSSATRPSVTRRRIRFAVGAFIVLLLAFLIFYFRSNVARTPDRLLSRRINF